MTLKKKRKPSPYEILLRAIKRLEKGWCQGGFAQTKDGASISYTSSKAACWCAKGAIYSASNNQGVPVIRLFDRLNDLVSKDDYGDIFDLVSFNDSPETTKSKVIRLFERAARGVKGKTWDQLFTS